MSTDIRMDEAFDNAVKDFEALIDRHFAAHRTLVVSNDEGKFWTAELSGEVLFRSPDGRATLRFARTFAERTPGVEVVIDEACNDELREMHSVRVDALSERGSERAVAGACSDALAERNEPAPRSESAPSNVVPLLKGATP